MIPHGTAREALFVETLGDMAALLDRVDALLPALQDTRQSLIDARAQLSRQLGAFEAHMNAITENAKVVTMNHVAKHTAEMTNRSVQRQIIEIQETARTALGVEIRPTLAALIAPLQRLAHLASQRESTWERCLRWMSYGATAAWAAVITGMMMMWQR